MSSTASLALSLFALRYLNAVGLTVLVYDHLLLLSREVQYIWTAKSSWFKWLFLFSHYSVPVYIFINALALGPILENPSTQFCQNWLGGGTVLGILSLAILNIFVAQRVYVLWGFNKAVLKLVCLGIGIAYTVTIIIGIVGVARSLRFIIYDPDLQTCTPLRISKLFAVAYGFPLYLELANFILLSCNALQRPRHLRTHIVKQLYLDGVVYFLVITVLRVLNIIASTGAFSQSNKILFTYFLWAMAPAIVHRMILTLNDNVDVDGDFESIATSGRYVREPWISSSPPPTINLTLPTNNSHFDIVEETYRFTDSVL